MLRDETLNMIICRSTMSVSEGTRVHSTQYTGNVQTLEPTETLK